MYEEAKRILSYSISHAENILSIKTITSREMRQLTTTSRHREPRHTSNTS